MGAGGWYLTPLPDSRRDDPAALYTVCTHGAGMELLLVLSPGFRVAVLYQACVICFMCIVESCTLLGALYGLDVLLCQADVLLCVSVWRLFAMSYLRLLVLLQVCVTVCKT